MDKEVALSEQKQSEYVIKSFEGPKLSMTLILSAVLNVGVYLYLGKFRWFLAGIGVFTFAGLLDYWFDSYFLPVTWLLLICHATSECLNFTKTETRPWYTRVSSILLMYCLVLSLFVVTRVFIFEPFRIPSNSMKPTLQRGDFILVTKVGYGTYGFLGLTLDNQSVSEDIEMKRGHLYVFYPPGKKGAYVKRLIGLPGDTIELNAQHEVIVNGEPLSTTNIPYNVDRNVEETLGDTTYLTRRFRNNKTRAVSAFKVPEKSFYLLGDNRDNSIDSRSFGFVADDRIIGKVVLQLNGKRD